MTRGIITSAIELPHDPRHATKYLGEMLYTSIYPLMITTRNKLQSYKGHLSEDEVAKLQQVFTLCISQIRKCLQSLFEVFKIEFHDQNLLQESRHYSIDRLAWCMSRLQAVLAHLDNTADASITIDPNDSILVTPIYFVNWIDHTFNILADLAAVVYKTDYKDSDELFKEWKEEIVECVSMLHISVDELLLSAMTLCKYYLPPEQVVIKARSQVVLRETIALLAELIDGDLNNVQASIETLKLPVKPCNINVQTDVLKDALYVLENNTNTALLALLVHCFTQNKAPVDVLKEHFENPKAGCLCQRKEGEIADECPVVKEFDLYNERLLQIGSFAVSCSSDQNRILSLRSGLATLEALDPHLVPSLMTSPASHHANLLVKSWRQEVQEIRDSVFLIVDPAAFTETSKESMHEVLLEILKGNLYNNSNVCRVINIGCVIYDFFNVYYKQEPDAVSQYDKLEPLMTDLNKVLLECKTVSNILSTENDFKYGTKNVTNKDVTVEQLFKRLKLLYTLIGRINSLLHPKENEDQLFGCEIDDSSPKNVTQTVYNNNGKTYVNSPKKAANMTRSIFARTNIRSSTRNFPLSQLTKHLQVKNRQELSFSLKIDQMFNLSETGSCQKVPNKMLESLREPSILYKFSPKKRSSLRKAVLSRQCKLPFDKVKECSAMSRDDVLDDATSLQITEILDQMSDMTSLFARSKTTRQDIPNKTYDIVNKTTESNVLHVNVNNATISKHIWNIPVNTSSVGVLDDSAVTASSSMSHPSNVDTFERISDIDLVESKLLNLQILELETSL